MKKIQEYLIRKWEGTIKLIYPDRFRYKEIEVVKIKKGKIREWRAFVDGKRITKEELKKLGFNS